MSRVRKIGPEEAIQRSVKDYLDVAAPYLMWWAVPNGGMSKGQNGRNKAMGARAGVLDLHFVLTGGRLAVIEMKAPKGTLSPEQKVFIAACGLSGVPWAVCRSVEEVEVTLRGWGVSLRATLSPPISIEVVG